MFHDDGFFISPSGQLFHVETNHIGVVLSNPGMFGLSKDDIVTVYRKNVSMYRISVMDL